MLVTVGERISIALMSMAVRISATRRLFYGLPGRIITTDNHTNARMFASPHQESPRTGPYRHRGGFSGERKAGSTSLGRGGSDTTAVALAAALNADYAEICSDVDVHSADHFDPRRARVAEMSYARCNSWPMPGPGASAEAVEWARREGIESAPRPTGPSARRPLRTARVATPQRRGGDRSRSSA